MNNTNHNASSRGIKLGDHICSIYANKEQQFQQLIPFFKVGLDKNQKCVYIVDEHTGKEVVAEFEKAGIDIEKYIASGQFKILTKKETYLRDGSFDPDKMIALCRQTEADALKEGYTGMRITGEMTWVLANLLDTNKLIEYESKLNNFFPSSQSAAICQYNENKFNHTLLVDVIRTHPYVMVHGSLYENKYFYTPPEYTTIAKEAFPTTAYKTMIEILQEGK